MCTSLGDIQRVRFLDKLFECDDAEFLESVHYLVDFKVYVSVGFDSELVFSHEFIGCECAMYAEVLVVLHWGAEVEVFNVDAHVAGSFVCIGYGSVNIKCCVKDR